MLLKVENIQEGGRFAVLRHRAPEFSQFTLIFARNGFGKSTVCSVLRSAVEGDANMISARRRLGAVAASTALTQWRAHGPVTFNGTRWNLCPGPVHIFDGEYVHRNLHVAESVTRDNKRSLLTVIFGAQGVALAKAVSDLDAEQRAIATAQTASERTIRAACRGVTDVGNFARATVPEDLEGRIGKAERNVELAKRAATVRDKRELVEVGTMVLDAYLHLAQRDVGHITENAAAQVKAHLDGHGMHPNGERWLKYGVDHQEGATCPFCTQDTTSVELVQVFKGYFSATYASLTLELDVALGVLRELLAEKNGFEQRLNEHAGDLEFWGSVCSLDAIPSLTAEARVRVRAALQAIVAMLEHKQANPLSKQLLNDEATVKAGLAELEVYRAQLAGCGPAIAEARQAARAADQAVAQTTLDKLISLKARDSAAVKPEVDAWLARDTRRAEIEKEKKKAQADLKTYVETTTKEKQEQINELLEHFGATFQVSNTKATFVGREPNTDYSIAIGPHLVPAGERNATQPSFNTVLSAGDKFTLALAFFLTQVRNDQDLANATVVFDDPFSSLDAHREWETTSQLRSLAQSACQVVVLSHDARFLSLIEKNTRTAPTTYQITCDDLGNGEIRGWSSADELRELYVRQCERIREYANAGNLLPNVTIESLVKDLRPFVEAHLRARYPGRFADLAMLDAVIGGVEAVGATDPLAGSVADLRALNEYTRDYMHAGAPVPNPGTLRAQCKRIVKIMGSW